MHFPAPNFCFAERAVPHKKEAETPAVKYKLTKEMTLAEMQEGSTAVPRNNSFCFASELLVCRSLVLYRQTQQDLLIQADPKTFKEAKKPDIVLLTPLLAQQPSSHHSSSFPSLSNTATSKYST